MDSAISRLFTSPDLTDITRGFITGCKKRIAIGPHCAQVDGIAARPYLEVPGGATRLAANKGAGWRF